MLEAQTKIVNQPAHTFQTMKDIYDIEEEPLTVAGDLTQAHTDSSLPTAIHSQGSSQKVATSTSPCAAAALEYGKQGFRVLPLWPFADGKCDCGNQECRAGKHPRITKWQIAASSDPEQIREWWNKWPDSGIGLATGSGSGVFVVDVDGDQGEDTLKTLMAKHDWTPNTLTAKTGKGIHLYFAHPGGKVKNSAGQVGLGIDVRGDGGFVVVPPSRHVNGTSYCWESEGKDIAIAPAWLIKLVTEFEQDTELEVQAVVGSDHAEDEDVVIFEGQRNTALTKIAGRLRAQGKSKAEIENELLVINGKNCRPPLPAAEVKKIAWSVARYDVGHSPTPLDRAREDNRLFYFPFNVQECKRPVVTVWTSS